jgi:hypothetical protein
MVKSGRVADFGGDGAQHSATILLRPELAHQYQAVHPDAKYRNKAVVDNRTETESQLPPKLNELVKEGGNGGSGPLR